MALQPQHEAKHNAMLGQRMANAEAFDSYEDEVENSRPLKRAKTGHSSHYERVEKTEIPDSDAESYTEDLVAVSASKSGLVGALPDIRTDQEAIDEYEAQKAAEQAHLEDTGGSFKEEKWVRGKSSIYVDAFNLALKTVLEEESHLFDDAEKAVFGYWNSLAYEAQYLFVTSFFFLTLLTQSLGTYDYFYGKLRHGTESTNWVIIVTSPTSTLLLDNCNDPENYQRLQKYRAIPLNSHLQRILCLGRALRSPTDRKMR